MGDRGTRSVGTRRKSLHAKLASESGRDAQRAAFNMDHSPVLPLNRWLALGRAGLDLYADPPGTRVEEARAFFPALGGSAANVAAGIARLGGSAALLTTLSSDAVGRFVFNELGAMASRQIMCASSAARRAPRLPSLRRATTTLSPSSIAMARPTFSFLAPMSRQFAFARFGGAHCHRHGAGRRALARARPFSRPSAPARRAPP